MNQENLSFQFLKKWNIRETRWIFYFELPIGHQAEVRYKHDGVHEQVVRIVDVEADTSVSCSNNYYTNEPNFPIGPFSTQKRYAVFAHFKFDRPNHLLEWNQAPGRILSERPSEKPTQFEYGFEDNYTNHNYNNIIVSINIKPLA